MIHRSTILTNVIALVLLGTSSLFPQATTVQIASGSIKSGRFEVKKGREKVPVESRELQARIELPNQKTETLYVSMLYDPHTKLFWWNTDAVAAANARKGGGISTLLPRDSVMCLTDSKFVLFWNGEFSGGYVFVLESAEHYLTLDEGQTHVLRVLHDQPEFIWKDQRINFPGLPRDFLFSKADSAIRIGPKLKDVTRVGNEWHISEEGPNGGSALIVLSDKYEVIRTTLQPSK